MRRFAVPVALASLALGLTLPPILTGRTPIPADLLATSQPWEDADPACPPVLGNRHHYDILNIVYPHEVLSCRALQGGDLPWWDPTTLGGHPLLADGQTATLYPPKLLLQAALPPRVAHALFLALHLAACGLAMYAYLRHLVCGWTAAAAGALAWMLGGLSMAYYAYGSFHPLGALLPLALIALDRLDGPRPAGPAAGLALALAGMLLSTHPQLLYYAAIIMTATAATRWVPLAVRAETRRNAFWSAAWAILSVATGLAIAAPQLLPLADLATHSQRDPGAARDLFPAGIRYAALMGTFVFPRIFGGPIDRVDLYDRFPITNMLEFQGYVGGATVLLLVPLGFAAATRRERWLWGGLSAVAILCAIGTPLYGILSRVVPGMNVISPFRILFLWSFSACVFSARGTDALLAAAGGAGGQCARFLRRWRWLLAAGAVAVALVALGAELAIGTGRAPPGSLLRWINIGNPVIHLPLFWWAGAVALAFLAAENSPVSSFPRSAALLPVALLSLITLDLLQLFTAYNPTHDPAPLDQVPAEYAWLRRQGNPHFRHIGCPKVPWFGYNLNAIAPILELSSAEGYESLYPGIYMRLTRHPGPSAPPHSHVILDRYDSPVLDLLSVRYALLPKDAKGVPPHWREAFRDRMVVWENPRALPRAYLVHRVRPYVYEDKAGMILADPGFRPSEECLSMDDDWRPGASTGPEQARIVEESFNTLRIDVQASAPAMLVVTDTWDPGWTATVDGSPEHVLRVNIAQRGIPVPAGSHRVEMRYAPRGIGLAWSLCATGLAGVAGLGWAARLARNRTGTGAVP